MSPLIIAAVTFCLFLAVVILVEARHYRKERDIECSQREELSSIARIADGRYRRQHGRRSTLLTNRFPELLDEASSSR